MLPYAAASKRCSVQNYWHENRFLFSYATYTFPIMHLICPPKILLNLWFSFLLGIKAIPTEIESNFDAFEKFWVPNKVHYGKCGSGVLNKNILSRKSFALGLVLKVTFNWNSGRDVLEVYWSLKFIDWSS